MDRFEKDTPRFLDINISALGQTAYIKNPHTGQYVNFEIHALWNCKIDWIRSLVKDSLFFLTVPNFKNEKVKNH